MTTRRLLCLVTDRRRLARTLGRPEIDASPLLLQQIEGAIRGGVDFVQIREHDVDAGALAEIVRRVRRLAAGTATRVMVNDRIDVAVAAGAHGVHLREASVNGDTVKRAWPALTVGRSVHSRDAVMRAHGIDYWIAGPIFPTPSKPLAHGIGADGLNEIVHAASGTPVFAIGGITASELSAIVRGGAQGMAAIGAFLPEPGAVNVAENVEKRVKTLRFAFDTASAVS